MYQIVALCWRFHWIEMKKGLHFPAITTLYFIWRHSSVCWEHLIRGWRAWNPVLVNTHPAGQKVTLKWDFPLDQRESEALESEHKVLRSTLREISWQEAWGCGTVWLNPYHLCKPSVLLTSQRNTIVLAAPRRKMSMLHVAVKYLSHIPNAEFGMQVYA